MRVILVSLTVAALCAPTATASWNRNGPGSGGSRAKTLGAAQAPTATASASKKTVTLTWAASSFAEGGAVPSYVVRRYNATTGVLQTIRANCANVVTGLTCTENNVPTGLWQYTIAAAAGTWRGPESSKSLAVTV